MNEKNTTLRERAGERLVETGEGMARAMGVNTAALKMGGLAGLAWALAPTVALAETGEGRSDGGASGALADFLPKIAGGVQFLGGILVVFGVVNLGLNLKDGAQGGGGQLAGAITSIVGGALVIAAGTYFKTLDTGFMSATTEN